MIQLRAEAAAIFFERHTPNNKLCLNFFRVFWSLTVRRARRLFSTSNVRVSEDPTSTEYLARDVIAWWSWRSIVPLPVTDIPMVSLGRIVVIGGAGRVALLFAARASKSYDVIALHRSARQKTRVEATGATSVLFDIEKATVPQIAEAVQSAQVVVFTAGASGSDYPSKLKNVDFEGVVKTADAIESLPEPRPRLILVSAHDIRPDQFDYPKHYTAEDKSISQYVWRAIGTYMKYKYMADADLVERTKLEWTILRPCELIDGRATGQVTLGVTHVGRITRDDVAAVLVELLQRPEAKGLVLDLISGDVPITEAVETAVSKRVTSWPAQGTSAKRVVAPGVLLMLESTRAARYTPPLSGASGYQYGRSGAAHHALRAIWEPSGICI